MLILLTLVASRLISWQVSRRSKLLGGLFSKEILASASRETCYRMSTAKHDKLHTQRASAGRACFRRAEPASDEPSLLPTSRTDLKINIRICPLLTYLVGIKQRACAYIVRWNETSHRWSTRQSLYDLLRAPRAAVKRLKERSTVGDWKRTSTSIR